jgi:DNA-binding MarR family transcriptional regulator
MAVNYKATNELTRRALIQAGLSVGQAAIYEALIHYGPQKATKLAFLSGVPRTLSYIYIEELIQYGLVTKEESGKVARFASAHPLELKKLAERQLEEAQNAKSLIEKALPALMRGFDDVLGTLPEAELYSRVAAYAGKAGLGPLSAQERIAMQKALQDLLRALEK